MKKIVVSGVQFAIRPNQIEANTEKCLKKIKEAYDQSRPRLIVLPETITTGFVPGMETRKFWELVEPLDGASPRAVKKLARRLKVWVVFPMYEKGRERGRIYNSALVISPQGRLAGVYRKTHPFPGERSWTTPGNALPVFNLGFAKMGITICYEGDFPELSRILALKGAEIIVRPSALLRSFEIWDFTNRARAYDNHVYLLAVNAVGGPDGGGNFNFGHSMIINPIGQKIAQARGTEEIVSAELDPEPLKFITYGTRSPMEFDHLEDRRIELYGDILKHRKSPFEPARRIRYKR